MQALDQGPSCRPGHHDLEQHLQQQAVLRACRSWAAPTACRSLNNEFAYLSPVRLRCAARWRGSALRQLHTLLKGNYFHDNGDSAGGLSMPADGAHDSLIEDNVWVCTCIYPWSIQAAATQNSIVRPQHLRRRRRASLLDRAGRVAARKRHPRQRVHRSVQRHHRQLQSRWGTQDHNLNSGLSGTGNITGTPVWTGGSKPTSYAGYHLAPSSPGIASPPTARAWVSHPRPPACRRTARKSLSVRDAEPAILASRARNSQFAGG